MDPRINKLLEEIPEKPPRSKLETHADVISALRRKRLTYREIAQFFQDHLAITVAPSTIHDFVRVRRKRGKRDGVSAGEQWAARPNRVSAPALKNTPADDDVQQRIAALKRRTPTEAPQPFFPYEEDEPLKLRRNPATSKSTERVARLSCIPFLIFRTSKIGILSPYMYGREIPACRMFGLFAANFQVRDGVLVGRLKRVTAD